MNALGDECMALREMATVAIIEVFHTLPALPFSWPSNPAHS
jgi:hypothetical protein